MPLQTPARVIEHTPLSSARNNALSLLTRKGREVTRLVDNTELAILDINATALVEHARLDAIDSVASRALQGVALISQLEQQLAGAVPMATSRLQAIGDMHALTVAGELASLSRRLG